MSKMDDMRAQLDAQSNFVPSPRKNAAGIEMGDIGGESKVISKKADPDNNRKLAQRIIELNPDLPVAFKSKFAIMAENTHFAKNVSVVIADCLEKGINLNM